MYVWFSSIPWDNRVTSNQVRISINTNTIYDNIQLKNIPVVKTHSYTKKGSIFDPVTIDESHEEFIDQNAIDKMNAGKEFFKKF